MSEELLNRLRTITVPAEIRDDLFTTGVVIEAGLPDDAQFIRHHERPALQCDEYVFWSSEFDVVPEGREIPSERLRTDVTDVDRDTLVDTEADRKQRKIIQISDELFSEMFRGRTRITDGIPPFAAITEQYRRTDWNCRDFIIKSPTFDAVGEGEIPDLLALGIESLDSSETQQPDAETSLSSYLGDAE